MLANMTSFEKWEMCKRRKNEWLTIENQNLKKKITFLYTNVLYYIVRKESKWHIFFSKHIEYNKKFVFLYKKIIIFDEKSREKCKNDKIILFFV